MSLMPSRPAALWNPYPCLEMVTKAVVGHRLSRVQLQTRKNSWTRYNNQLLVCPTLPCQRHSVQGKLCHQQDHELKQSRGGKARRGTLRLRFLQGGKDKNRIRFVSLAKIRMAQIVLATVIFMRI